MRARATNRRCRWWACGLALAVLATLCRPPRAGGEASQPGSPPAGPVDVGPSPLSPARALTLFQRLASPGSTDIDSLLALERAANPGDPYVLLARLKSCWWRILAGRDEAGRLRSRMREDLSQLQDCLEPKLATDPSAVEAAWILGEAHCTMGRLDALEGRTWSAFRHHQRGVGLLEDVRRSLPDAPEPRASIGLYRYYAARLPRSLRLLGRLAGLRGDRAGGLADLRAAAADAGLQRTEAQFFLVQVLQHDEGETFEALSIARLAYARDPHQLGFALLLSDVLVSMHEPAAALEVLAVRDSADACARAQSALLRARVYADTGRPAAALATLARLGASDRGRVSWLGPWICIVRGRSLAALGQRAAARLELDGAGRSDDVAGSRAAAAAALEQLADPLESTRLRAESLLTWAGDPGGARALLAQALDGNPRCRPGTAILLALGRAALLAGDARGAIAPLRRAVEQGGGDDVALVVGPRIRLLQALVWSGEVDEAAALARRFEPQLDRWGTNRQLATLVDEILHPPRTELPLELEPAGRAGETFRLADLGFTAVDLVVARQRRVDRLPMAWVEGAWVVHCAMPPGAHAYVFLAEGREPIIDPQCDEVVERDGAVWSVRRSGGPS